MEQDLPELCVVVKAEINGVPTTVILDSGAGPSVLDYDTLKNLGLAKYLNENPSNIYGLSQAPVAVIGNAHLTVDLGDNQIVLQRFQITDTGTTRILGRDLLRKFGPTEFDWEAQRVRLGGVWKESGVTVKGGEPLSRATAALLEANMPNDGSDHDIVNPALESDQREQLIRLVNQYRDVFADNPKKPAVTNKTKHTIDTGNSRPVKCKALRVAPAVEREIGTQVRDMLANGICKPSDSPWSSRVILITKKDGSIRFCIDYRNLNEITRKDAYPMPTPSDILDKMHGDNYFSFLDGASAYWAVEMEEGDKQKTAFSTPRGHYEMVRMPFGLCNSQATYQRLMDSTLEGIEAADPYVDDTCVHSRNFESHVYDLRRTFEAYRQSGIQLRQDKCRIGYMEGEFVGHIISAKGHRPVPSTVARICEAERPKSQIELLRFLGMVNYYRDYIPRMASTAEPLYRLTSKGKDWKWDDEEEKAFRELKRSLAEFPNTLSFPDWNRELYLQTDASSVAVGAVLMQRNKESKLMPIAFSSSGLTNSQKNYSAGELECWALIAASRKFRKYLQAADKIHFISDHNPLSWLRRQKDPRHKFARWIQELESFDYEVEYIKGASNYVADYLSRLQSEVDPEVNDEEEFFERHVFSIAEEKLDGQRIRECQESDPATSFALEQLEAGGVILQGRFKHQRGMHLKQGI